MPHKKFITKHKQMFIFLLTTAALYDTMQEYRRMNRLCSFAVP